MFLRRYLRGNGGDIAITRPLPAPYPFRAMSLT